MMLKVKPQLIIFKHGSYKYRLQSTSDYTWNKTIKGNSIEVLKIFTEIHELNIFL